MAEGYVKIEEGKAVYIYNYTDHLGNVRLSYTDKNGIAQVLQEKNYYPFGLQHKGYNESTDALAQGYKYGYNGKELQSESNLNWYDYGARNYSPALGRWFAVDPLAEKFPSWSPYNFTFNNPLRFVDPDGMAPDDWVEKTDKDGNKSIVWDKNVTNANDKDLKEGDKYLGKAVVVFEGSRDEKLGKGDNLFGKGANLAKVTVYGPSGADDVKEYGGFTMSSNYEKFGAIDDGKYDVYYRNPGKSGSLKSNWAVENTRPVDVLDGINPNPHGYSATQKNGIYIHRSNNNGYAGETTKGAVSTGCPLICPSRYDAKGNLISPGWDQYNNQLKGLSRYKLIMTGRRK